jgi:hypothetical protein
LGIFVLLALATVADVLWSWTRTRRAHAREPAAYGVGPNEMVVVHTDSV